MNKRAWMVLFVAMLFLTVSFFMIWQLDKPDQTQMELMYHSSLSRAVECFSEYRNTGEESIYWEGVAEYYCMMKAYLIIHDGSTPDYTVCNIVYGEMLKNPGMVQQNISLLTQALGMMTREQTEMTGFLRLSELSNLLIHG